MIQGRHAGTTADPRADGARFIASTASQWLKCHTVASKRYGIPAQSQPSRQFKAHRVAWEMANSRSVRDGWCVLHRCDNPPCVNPAHLFLGSVDDNNKDRSVKGRSSQGADHWTRARPEGLARDSRNGHATTPEATRRGSVHPRARLTRGGRRSDQGRVSGW